MREPKNIVGNISRTRRIEFKIGGITASIRCRLVTHVEQKGAVGLRQDLRNTSDAVVVVGRLSGTRPCHQDQCSDELTHCSSSPIVLSRNSEDSPIAVVGRIEAGIAHNVRNKVQIVRFFLDAGDIVDVPQRDGTAPLRSELPTRANPIGERAQSGIPAIMLRIHHRAAGRASIGPCVPAVLVPDPSTESTALQSLSGDSSTKYKCPNTTARSSGRSLLQSQSLPRLAHAERPYCWLRR